MNAPLWMIASALFWISAGLWRIATVMRENKTHYHYHDKDTDDEVKTLQCE